jgi:hypothetical protein
MQFMLSILAFIAQVRSTSVILQVDESEKRIFLDEVAHDDSSIAMRFEVEKVWISPLFIWAYYRTENGPRKSRLILRYSLTELEYRRLCRVAIWYLAS